MPQHTVTTISWPASLPTVVIGDHANPPAGLESVSYRLGDPWDGGAEWVASKGCSWMSEHGVFLIVDDATPAFIEDLMRPIDVFVVAHGPLVGLILNFGNVMDAESMMWLRPDQEVPVLLTTYSPRMPLLVMLVDHATKKIAHMRTFSLSPHATKVLVRECLDRWTVGTDEAGGARAFAEFESKYPTLAAAKRGAFARCHAGD